MKVLRSSHGHLYTSVDYLVGSILLCYPALLFLIRGGMNGSLFLLAAIAVLVLVQDKGNIISIDRQDWAFAAAMSSGLIAILVSQLYNHDLTARYFDSAARFLLAIPVLLALRHVKVNTPFVLQFAFPLGAIAAFVAVMMKNPAVRYSASTSYMNHIHLGDLALMLGCLSLLSLNWIQRDHLMIKALKVMGLIAGLVVSVLSSARGGWIAIPVFIAIFVHFRIKGKLLNKIALATVLVGMIGLLGYFFVDAIRQRVWMVYSDLHLYITGADINTSIGVRLQLWQAAFHLIAEHPFFGVGADGFGRAMDVLSASGFVTPIAAELGKGEVHNEILANTVRFGIFGLLSIMAVYFVPFFLFLRAAKSADHQKIRAAMMGMCLTLGFFIFGLTVETFDLKMTAAFYSLTAATLLAAATRQSSAGESNSAVTWRHNV